MGTLTGRSEITQTLLSGQTLTVATAANSTATVVRQGEQAGAEDEARTSLSASSSSVFGPYATAKRFLLTALTGTVTYTIDPIDVAALIADAIADLCASSSIIFSALPTADPEVEGQLWNDAGALKVSAGA